MVPAWTVCMCGSLSGSARLKPERLSALRAALRPIRARAADGGNWAVHDPDHPETGYGKFVFELGSTDFDRLIVTRDLTLGGTLSVSFLDGFTLGPDLTFPIIDLRARSEPLPRMDEATPWP